MIYQQLNFTIPTNIKVGIWAGETPKNLPDWFKKQYAEMSGQMDISGSQLLDLINCGVEVRVTHENKTGNLIIWVDEVGKGFSIR